MTNPFDGLNYSNKARKLLEPEVYFGVCKEIKLLDKVDKDGQPKKKILISFLIPNEDTSIAAFFWPSMNEKSFLIKFLRGVLGDALSDEVRLDKDKLWALINKLRGREFKLMVSKNGDYNNIDSAILIKNAAPLPAAAIPTPKKEAQQNFMDDDIPF